MIYDRSKSRCSAQADLAFHWFDGIRHADKQALDTATEAFMSALQGPKRLWNPYAEAAAKSEFKKRVLKAARGDLKPVDEVKGVDEDKPAPLYEIRWQGISVTERDGVDAPHVHLDVIVRMYHSEPAVAPDSFIGHHVHEKVITPGIDPNDDQNLEIAKARNLYYAGEGVAWYLK